MRYEAAQIVGVEPVFEEFNGDDDQALQYVLRANGDRRHLFEGQKASAAIIINANWARMQKTLRRSPRLRG